MSALNGSRSAASMERRRDPESSDGAKGASQMAHACSRSERSWTRDTVTDAIGRSSRFRTELACRSWFKGRFVHASDRFFLESVIVAPLLLPRHFARRSFAFIQ